MSTVFRIFYWLLEQNMQAGQSFLQWKHFWLWSCRITILSVGCCRQLGLQCLGLCLAVNFKASWKLNRAGELWYITACLRVHSSSMIQCQTRNRWSPVRIISLPFQNLGNSLLSCESTMPRFTHLHIWVTGCRQWSNLWLYNLVQ